MHAVDHGVNTIATLTIRNVDPKLKETLRVRAARHGRSMEAELRVILSEALRGNREEPVDLFTAIRRHVDPVGGVELSPSDRGIPREPPTFE